MVKTTGIFSLGGKFWGGFLDLPIFQFEQLVRLLFVHIFPLWCFWAAALETPSTQSQEGSPELLIRSLVGGPSAELLLDLERVLCREGSPGDAVRPLLRRLQRETQPFLLLLRMLDAPGPNKSLLLTVLRCGAGRHLCAGVEGSWQGAETSLASVLPLGPWPDCWITPRQRSSPGTRFWSPASTA